MTPELVVEFAFGYGPNDVVPTSGWTNVTTYVRGLDPFRGRSNERADFDASTCSFTLTNDDRRFDPLNLSGPYAGKLLPNVPARARALVGVTYFDLWRGLADGFRMMPGSHASETTVDCTDSFKLLAQKRLASVYDGVILADEPVGYWRMGATTGQACIDASGNQNDGTYYGVLNRGAESVVPYASNGAAGSVANETGKVILPLSARIDARPISIEMWVQTNSATPLQPYASIKNLYLQPQWEVTREGFGWQLGGDSATDQFIIVYYVGPVYNFVQSFRVNVNDGAPHHLVLLLRNLGFNGFALCYVDGVLAPERAEASGGVAPLLTSNPEIGGASNQPEWIGRQDEVAIYDYELTVDQINAHYQAGVAPWDGDTTGTRITKVLDLISWPAAMRDVDSGEFQVGPAPIEGTFALAHLKAVANSEQGRLFIDAAGRLTFHDRGHDYLEALAYTFSDAAGGIIVDPSVDVWLDDTFVFNEVTAERVGGEAQTIVDDTSSTTYGPQPASLTGLILRSDTDARRLAEGLVFRNKDAKSRLGSWTVQPSTSADWSSLLALEIGNRVRVTLTPQSVGSAFTVDVHLESIKHSIDVDGEWLITFTGSPVDPTTYFTWGGAAGTGWGDGSWR